MTVVMRVPQGDVAGPLHEAERIAWSLSPFTNVYAAQRLSDALADLNWRPRFAAAVLAAFAALAFVLAALGLYAVVTYTVADRRREIGVRMALGADGSSIVAGVVGGALRVVAAGLVAGNIAAVLSSRALVGLLYGVAATDLATYAIVSVSLIVVALVACAGPAVAAARLDPQVVMRP